MSYETLLVSKDNQIALITINRPDKLNALNDQVLTDLNSAVDELLNDDEVRSIIITGAGAKAFVAGADITQFVDLDNAGGVQLAKKGHDVFNKIENSSKPIVAAVNGFALGGGCELAMACHFRIASENAKFGQPEVNLGLIPGYGGTQRLTQLVGKGKAMELCMTAHIIDANEAEKLGLVNHVTTQETLLNHTKQILEIINSKAPLAVAKSISCINAANSADGYETEIKLFGDCFDTEDKNEGVDAFLNKRKANFVGK